MASSELCFVDINTATEITRVGRLGWYGVVGRCLGQWVYLFWHCSWYVLIYFFLLARGLVFIRSHPSTYPFSSFSCGLICKLVPVQYWNWNIKLIYFLHTNTQTRTSWHVVAFRSLIISSCHLSWMLKSVPKSSHYTEKSSLRAQKQISPDGCFLLPVLSVTVVGSKASLTAWLAELRPAARQNDAESRLRLSACLVSLLITVVMGRQPWENHTHIHGYTHMHTFRQHNYFITYSKELDLIPPAVLALLTERPAVNMLWFSQHVGSFLILSILNTQFWVWPSK